MSTTNDTVPWLNDESDVRGFALFLSVLKYGLANLANGTLPASDGVVMETAQKFTEYINEGKVAPNGNGTNGNRDKGTHSSNGSTDRAGAT